MGGRSASSGFSNSHSALTADAPERTIETVYNRRGRYYKEEVYEATDDGMGNISIDRAQGEFDNSGPRTNVQIHVTFKLKHGLLVGNRSVESFGIDWDKVQSVSGNTYQAKDYAKEHGLKWDSKNKQWVRPK